MSINTTKNNFYVGVLLALLAVVIWSGNYVVARGIIEKVPPIGVAFYRWFFACICIIPLGFKQFKKDLPVIKENKRYVFFAALTGITLFNTFIYLAGHHIKAINLALIGTTAAPIFATILAAIFLKEIITAYRVTGMAICFVGILFLLAKGSWQNLANFHFEKGDVLMFVSAMAFAVYNTLVRKKPVGIAPLSFLLITFVVGTLLLLPFFLYEYAYAAPVKWNSNLLYTFAYLAIGNSVIAFLCWNASIKRLGASVTVLFANLIPVFSTLEAVIFLKEDFSDVHLISGCLIISGLIIANIFFKREKALTNDK